MDFGKVADSEISLIDFMLPPDGAQTAQTLKGRKPGKAPSFHVGCGKWGRSDWRGLIYPQHLKEADFLIEYPKHFDSLELNAVFYSIPPLHVIDSFLNKVSQHARTGFLMFPKMSRAITHIKRLHHAAEPLELYLKNIRGLGPYLGQIFLQMGDNFGRNNFDTLKGFLESLPKDLQFFMELRHEEWFSDPDNRQAVFNLLSQHNIGSVITDSSGRRDVIHMELSIPQAYIRFVGNGEKFRDSDFARIDSWVDRIKMWVENGLEKVFFIVHQHDERDTPVLAQYAIDRFNNYLGANIPKVVLHVQTSSSGSQNT